MKLSMTLNYAGSHADSARQAIELEKAGLDVVWVAEAYSYDAPSFMGYLAAKTERLEIGSAILPIYIAHAHAHRHDGGRHRRHVGRPLHPRASAPRAPRSSRASTACPTTGP